MPRDYAVIAAIAHHCGATPHELNELLRLWTAATTAVPREDVEADPDVPHRPVGHQDTGPEGRLTTGPRGRLISMPRGRPTAGPEQEPPAIRAGGRPRGQPRRPADRFAAAPPPWRCVW
ncbi:hypothetical protein [Streptomyces bugieae]|uniref:Uncharacterized protein n=1 Tax=Streptomyces bugieae TaxID=3098223 RepID=A0ABU7NKI6_9ACTN|nr:hypothetical protein [Streptomyces sp. DSM 41528]